MASSEDHHVHMYFLIVICITWLKTEKRSRFSEKNTKFSETPYSLIIALTQLLLWSDWVALIQMVHLYRQRCTLRYFTLKRKTVLVSSTSWSWPALHVPFSFYSINLTSPKHMARDFFVLWRFPMSLLITQISNSFSLPHNSKLATCFLPPPVFCTHPSATGLNFRAIAIFTHSFVIQTPYKFKSCSIQFFHFCISLGTLLQIHDRYLDRHWLK